RARYLVFLGFQRRFCRRLYLFLARPRQAAAGQPLALRRPGISAELSCSHRAHATTPVLNAISYARISSVHSFLLVSVTGNSFSSQLSRYRRELSLTETRLSEAFPNFVL